MKRDIKAIVKQMTLEEKAGMCSGEDFLAFKECRASWNPECDGK